MMDDEFRLMPWTPIVATTRYGFGGIYAVSCSRTGKYLVSAAGRSIAKRVWDARYLLARGRFPNPDVQAEFERDPASVTFHFLHRCNSDHTAGLKRSFIQLAAADGLSLNRKAPSATRTTRETAAPAPLWTPRRRSSATRTLPSQLVVESMRVLAEVREIRRRHCFGDDA